MKNLRLSRISVLTVAISTSTVLASALGAMLTASVAFADDPIDASLDLPIDQPTKQAPTVVHVAPTPPPTQDPQDSPLPPKFFGHDLPSKGSIVYVIDQSGSMSLSVASFTDMSGNTVSGTRMDRAKTELKKSIATLPGNFTFNVLFYDECVRPWMPASVPANDGNKQAADTFIDSQGPMGFTNTGLGVATALQDKSNHEVVLLSDGEPNFLDCAANYVGTFQDHRNLIRQANTQSARIDCFGIGVASDPNARNFMMQIAQDNNGVYIECN